MRVGPTLDQILHDYPNDVRVVFKMHPLSMHPNAQIAAEAAMAAKAQGKFFEMHRKLLENSHSLSRETLLGLAKDLGLDLERFTRELDGHTYLPAIQLEATEVESIGAGGTPASFINGRYVSGAQPYASFKTLIDEELKWAREGNRPAFTVGKNVSEAAPPRAAAQGPDPSKVFDLPVGDAPFRGPVQAKVTILHYLDYQ